MIKRHIVSQLGTHLRSTPAPIVRDTIPRCHACGGTERPFRICLVGGQWWHICDVEADRRVAVCPACGATPQEGDWFCAKCRTLDEQLVIRAEDIARPVGRVQRGRRGR